MNKVYLGKMYNKEVKEDFLKRYALNSEMAYKRVFLKSADLERRFSKDLYEFNFKEIEGVLYALSPISLAASETNVGVVSAYIDWAIHKGLTSVSLNPLRGFSINFEKYIASKVDELLKTEQEIFNLVDHMLVNPQDQVCVLLPFLGVQGQGCAEMVNLKRQDIDFKNYTLNLADKDGSTRQLKIDHDRKDYIFSILEEALTVDIYHKSNNTMDEKPNILPYTNLVMNDYVIRASNISKKTDPNAPVLNTVIYRRMRFMNEEFGVPTIKYIARSGMLAMAYKLWKRDGELTDKQYKKIQEQFNFKVFSVLKKMNSMKLIKEVYVSE